jgi:hypothetical protein
MNTTICRTSDYFNDIPRKEINVNSLTDLMELAKSYKCNEFVLHFNGDRFTIEVYDSYRE